MKRSFAAVLLLLATPAFAQPEGWVQLEAGAGFMVSDTYRDTFDTGFAGALRGGIVVADPLSVQVGMAAAFFPVDGDEPGTLYVPEVGARAAFQLGEGFVGGPFVDANVGLAFTGDLKRFTLNAGAGWAFNLDPAELGLVVRYRYLNQPNGQDVPNDAHLLDVGVVLGLRFGGEPDTPEVVGPVDDDGDGLPDDRDACPSAAEDLDGVEDDDGCPETDADGDGIDDENDRCPRTAETRNGFEDDDGCADEAPAPEPVAPPPPPVAEPVPELLPQRVLFRIATDRVSPRFRGPIQEVCAIMSERPNVRLWVIGHADEQGTPAANHRLGAQRAGAVAEQLVICGVDPQRLESRSRGNTEPDCAESSRECMQQNRRVHFELVEH